MANVGSPSNRKARSPPPCLHPVWFRARGSSARAGKTPRPESQMRGNPTHDDDGTSPPVRAGNACGTTPPLSVPAKRFPWVVSIKALRSVPPKHWLSTSLVGCPGWFAWLSCPRYPGFLITMPSGASCSIWLGRCQGTSLKIAATSGTLHRSPAHAGSIPSVVLTAPGA